MAVPFSVCLQAQLPGSQLLFFQLLRNTVSRSVVHLVRRLPFERRVRQMAVVLLDVERDQLPYAGRVIECVQEQPLVLDHAPPRLNQ